jgi:hypothetical protein
LGGHSVGKLPFRGGVRGDSVSVRDRFCLSRVYRDAGCRVRTDLSESVIRFPEGRCKRDCQERCANSPCRQTPCGIRGQTTTAAKPCPTRSELLRPGCGEDFRAGQLLY